MPYRKRQELRDPQRIKWEQLLIRKGHHFALVDSHDTVIMSARWRSALTPYIRFRADLRLVDVDLELAKLPPVTGTTPQTMLR